MTKAVFSPFHKPVAPPDQPADRKAGPQYLRLASTSLGNTISVETFELQRTKGATSSRQREQGICTAPLHTSL
jgi:prolactin regulatory element-binding protein